jgi:hypothetical protein
LTFRGLTENRRTRQYEVFSTLDSHVKVPVTETRSMVERTEFFEAQYPNGVAIRTWRMMARQFDPELRRADL